VASVGDKTARNLTVHLKKVDSSQKWDTQNWTLFRSLLYFKTQVSEKSFFLEQKNRTFFQVHFGMQSGNVDFPEK
jgi:hypothetical protein